MNIIFLKSIFSMIKTTESEETIRSNFNNLIKECIGEDFIFIKKDEIGNIIENIKNYHLLFLNYKKKIFDNAKTLVDFSAQNNVYNLYTFLVSIGEDSGNIFSLPVINFKEKVDILSDDKGGYCVKKENFLQNLQDNKWFGIVFLILDSLNARKSFIETLLSKTQDIITKICTIKILQQNPKKRCLLCNEFILNISELLNNLEIFNSHLLTAIEFLEILSSNSSFNYIRDQFNITTVNILNEAVKKMFADLKKNQNMIKLHINEGNSLKLYKCETNKYYVLRISGLIDDSFVSQFFRHIFKIYNCHKITEKYLEAIHSNHLFEDNHDENIIRYKKFLELNVSNILKCGVEENSFKEFQQILQRFLNLSEQQFQKEIRTLLYQVNVIRKEAFNKLKEIYNSIGHSLKKALFIDSEMFFIYVKDYLNIYISMKESIYRLVIFFFIERYWIIDSKFFFTLEIVNEENLNGSLYLSEFYELVKKFRNNIESLNSKDIINFLLNIFNNENISIDYEISIE